MKPIKHIFSESAARLKILVRDQKENQKDVLKRNWIYSIKNKENFLNWEKLREYRKIRKVSPCWCVSCPVYKTVGRNGIGVTRKIEPKYKPNPNQFLPWVRSKVDGPIADDLFCQNLRSAFIPRDRLVPARRVVHFFILWPYTFVDRPL